MILDLRHCTLLVLTWLTILGSVACTERVPTTPTPTSSPIPSSTPTPTPTPSCTYEISPTNRLHGPGAETGTVSVTAPSGCGWTASSGVSWVAITSGGSGTGSGTVAYAVQANSGEGRTATLTVAGRAFAIEQAVLFLACRLADIADVSRWRVQTGPSPGTVRVSGQQVELRVVSGQVQAGIASPCALQGDFDVQVDYALINWPAGNTYGLRLLGRVGGAVSLAINRTPSNYSLYLDSTLIPPNIPTTDTRGQLRLARTGASIAGFYSTASGWTRLAAADVGTGPTSFVLDLSSGIASTPSETVITFNNFRINSGTPSN